MHQEAIYTATSDDILRLLREKGAAEDAIVSENIEMRKQLRENGKRLARVQAEKKQLEREGVQKQIADLSAIPAHGSTGKDRQRHFKEMAHAQAKQILASRGGLVSNTELAAMLGLNSHGLAGVIGDCPDIVKEYDGRSKNEKTFWRLVK